MPEEASTHEARSRRPGELDRRAQLFGGWFLTLTQDERPDLTAHLLRLPEASVRTRFLRAMSPGALADHARQTLETGAETIGWYPGTTLRGVAELHEAGPGRTAEAALSVEPAWRGRGVGRALLGQVLRRARNRGTRRLVVMTTRDNLPMIHIARGGRADVATEGAEVVGTFDLAAPNLASRLADLAAEQRGTAALIATRMGRMAAAWLPAAP